MFHLSSEVFKKLAYHFAGSASISVHGRGLVRLCKDGVCKEHNDHEKKPRRCVTFFRV